MIAQRTYVGERYSVGSDDDAHDLVEALAAVGWGVYGCVSGTTHDGYPIVTLFTDAEEDENLAMHDAIGRRLLRFDARTLS